MPSLRFCCYISTRSPPNSTGRNRWLEWCLLRCLHTQLLPTEGHSSCSEVLPRYSLTALLMFWSTEFLLPSLLRFIGKSWLQRRFSCNPLIEEWDDVALWCYQGGSKWLYKTVRTRGTWRSEGKESRALTLTKQVYEHILLFNSYNNFVKSILIVSIFIDKNSPQRD